jgi:hypothetical protein
MDRPKRLAATYIVLVIISLAAGVGIGHFADELQAPTSSAPSKAGGTYSLSKGDYAEYTGKVAPANPAVKAPPYNETTVAQVIDLNGTAVEWVVNTTINGQMTQDAYWVKSGVSPFHFNDTNISSFALIKPYNTTTRVIGGIAIDTAVYVYETSFNYTDAFYYVAGQPPIFPVEVTSTNGIIFSDIYLTGTNIVGLEVVQPKG